jgi:hypothetical protein
MQEEGRTFFQFLNEVERKKPPCMMWDDFKKGELNSLHFRDFGALWEAVRKESNQTEKAPTVDKRPPKRPVGRLSSKTRGRGMGKSKKLSKKEVR